MRRRPAVGVIAALVLAATGPAAGAASLLPAGDVDGDGKSDLLVRDGAALRLYSGAAPNGTMLWPDAEALTAEAVVAMGGDLDGDGRADLVIGEPDVLPAGRVRILLSDPEVPDVELLGELPGDRFGATVAATDLDGDGLSELAVGAPGRAPTGWIGVYAGPVTAEAAPADVLLGLQGVGARVERVWDVDGDGFSDLLVVDGEVAYVVHGGRDGTGVGGGLYDAWAVGPMGDVDADAQAELSWWLGPSPTEVGAGETAVAAGDLDGDLVADVLIRGPGGVRAVCGAKSAAERRVLADVALDPAATPVGDVDGDGFADLAWLDDAGRITVWRGHGTLFGAPVASWRPPADPTPAVGGDTVTFALDLLGGFDELGPYGSWPTATGTRLVVGLPDADLFGVDSGAWAVLFGSDERLDGVLGATYPWPSLQNWRPGARAGASVAGGLLWRAGVLVVGMPGNDWRDPEFATPPSPELEPVPDVGAFAVVAGQWPQLFSGSDEGQRRGASIALVGDLNGDGVGDFVEVLPGVGAKNDPVGEARAYLVPASRPNDRWGFIFDVPPTWIRTGETPGSPVTAAVAAGDLNGDAAADFALTRPDADHVEVYGQMTEDGKASALSLLHPPLGPGAHFGATVVAAGDVDDDGYGDLAVAAPDSGAGSVFVYYGARGFVDLGRTQLISGWADGERFGATLAAPGDVDGDGFADLVVGAPDHGGGRGRIALYRGGPEGLDTAASWELVGERPDGHLGLALASGLDWNGDGFGDLAVAERDSPGQVAVFVLAGNDGMRGHAVTVVTGTTDGVAFAPTVPWAGISARDSVEVLMTPASPFAGAVELEAEVRATVGEELHSTTVSSIATVGATRLSNVRGLTPSTAYQLRGRVVFPVADAPLQPASRWRRAGLLGQPARVHFRTRANRAPVARPDRYRATERVLTVQPPGVLLNDDDLDLDPLRVAALVHPVDRGQLELRPDGGFVYTAEPGDIGEVIFAYRVEDGFGVSEEAWVTVELRPCDPYSCADGAFSVDLKGAGGGRMSVRCQAHYEVDPPEIRCDTTPDGSLSLSATATCRPE
ncbi:MAG: hypothetical protein EP329_27075 [Deltaproteobacteria bacterium]|nr:MAG: hypothetical protein EP329_27075 [Deltaproteobacteria bacterium]